MKFSKRSGLIATLFAGITAASMAGAAVLEQPAQKPREAAPKAKIGQKAPDFTLSDLDGKQHSLKELQADDKIVVLEWFNPECPFVVRHYDESFDTMNKLAEEYKDDVVWVRINSNAEGQQGSGIEKNKQYKESYRIEGPILMDPGSEVAALYGAQTTPHMYIIDAEGILRYHGAIDDDVRGKNENRTNYVKQALDQILAGETVTQTETRPYGCTVKYASKN